MGWSSGSSLMSMIIEDLQFLDDDTRLEVYKVLIEKFQEKDCDTLDECVDSDDVFKAALIEMDHNYHHALIEDEYNDEQ